MEGWDWRRRTGVVGFVWVVIQVAAIVLFLMAGSPPEFGDAKKFTAWINTNSGLLMGDAFLTGVATLPLLTQLTGVRSIIRNAGEGWEWAATLFFGAGTVIAASSSSAPLPKPRRPLLAVRAQSQQPSAPRGRPRRCCSPSSTSRLRPCSGSLPMRCSEPGYCRAGWLG